MPDPMTCTINGQSVAAHEGQTVAALLLQTGHDRLRRSVAGEPRGPLCAMGICFECRVTINGRPQQLACMTPCEPGMEVVTDG